jgi:transcription elongation factor GreA
MEMCKESISRRMFEFLSNHIMEVERRKSILIGEYYREKAEEAMEVESFFREYARAVNQFLSTVEIGKGSDEHCPIAIIGSTVEVQDLDDPETYRYRIVYPYSKKADAKIDDASCLSPLGRALLLNRINQQVNISIPAGELRYVIKKITVHEQPVSGHKETQKLTSVSSASVDLTI